MPFRRLLDAFRRRGKTPPSPLVVDFTMPPYVEGETDYPDWVRTGIRGFREWYQPVDFGDGLVAHVTVPPDWKPRPELDRVRGMAKWEKIVRKHVPDVTGKRVLDLGCNNGVFSLELARMGAAEVVGIDRNREIRQKSSTRLPAQDVIAQAGFVKRAFEIKEGVTHPVRFVAHDIARIGDLDLGRFDLVLALCVVYHELEGTSRLVQTLASMTDHLVLQTCLTHGGVLAEWAAPDRLADLLRNAGLSQVEIDAPPGYDWPMIVGRR